MADLSYGKCTEALLLSFDVYPKMPTLANMQCGKEVRSLC